MLDFFAPHAVISSSPNPDNCRATIVLLRLTGLAHRRRKCEGRLPRLGGKRTYAAANHNDEISSSDSFSPPVPATVVVWLQRKESEGRITAPEYLASYPLTEVSVDYERKASFLSCVWPHESSLIGFDFSSGQLRTVTIGVGLKIPGVDRIQPLGVASVYVPVNEESEWNLSVSVDPMKHKFPFFSKLSNRKDCEYTVLPSTVFHMKLQVTRKASAPGIYDALVEKKSVEHACDEGTNHDATNATSEDSIPDFLGMSSSDGSKPAKKPVGASRGTKKDPGIKDDKAREFISLKYTPPPTSSAVEHFTKLAPQRKFQIKRIVQEPLPVAIQRCSSKAKEKKCMHTRAKTTETLKTSRTATDKNLNRAVRFDSSDSFDDSLDNFFFDPYRQSVQINNVVLFPAFETASSLQSSAIPQIHNQDGKRLNQQQGQMQICNDGQEKTILADLVFAYDKSHNSDAPADDVGHSLQKSCDVPSTEIVIPQWMPDIICEDNESTEARLLERPDRSTIRQAQVHDQDVRRLNQEQSQMQICNVGQDKTILADDKLHSWDGPADDAGHSLQKSCEVPSMEIVVPQRMPDIICDDNASTEARLLEQPDRQVLKQDIVQKKTLAEVVPHINSQSSDVSACSVATEIHSGVEQSRQKQGVNWDKMKMEKKEKGYKKTTTTLTTNMKKELMNMSKKSKKSLPRIIGKRVRPPAFNSLITNGAKERKEPVALFEHKNERFELKVITANDEIEEDSLTQATRLKLGRWKIEEDSATSASTATIDTTEASIRSSEYDTQERWTTVFEEVGLVCSNIFLCGIIEEETHGDDDFVLRRLNSDGSTIYSESDSHTKCTNGSGEYSYRQDSQDEYSQCYRQEFQDTEYDSVLQQKSEEHKRKQGREGRRLRHNMLGVKRRKCKCEV